MGERGAITVVTWNLLGSQRPDLAEVASALRALDADVVALQEVSRRDARRLAEQLGGWSRRWQFKHWGIRVPAEGLAVLTPHRLASTSRIVLRRAAPWNWRRRVAIIAHVELPADRVTIVNLHLSAHADGTARLAEIERLGHRLERLDGGHQAIVMGDVNEGPGGAAHTALVAAGRVDAWAAVHGDDQEPAGATNWTAGPRAGRLPTQRLDHVFIPAGWCAESAQVPTCTQTLAALSDHLPLAVSVFVDRRSEVHVTE